MSDRLSDAALDKLLAYRACSHERKCLDVSPGDPFGWCPDCVVTALASEARASRANGGGDGEVELLIAEAFKRAVDPKYVRHIDPEYLTGDALAFLLARAIRSAPSVPATSPPACPQCNNADTVYSPNEGEIPCGTCERARLRGAVASPPAPVEQPDDVRDMAEMVFDAVHGDVTTASEARIAAKVAEQIAAHVARREADCLSLIANSAPGPHVTEAAGRAAACHWIVRDIARVGVALAAIGRGIPASPPAPVEQATIECPWCKRPDGAVNHVEGHVFVGWGNGWQPCQKCGGSCKLPAPPASAPVEDAPDYVPACECGKPTPLGLLCLACASAKDVTPDGCAPVEDARPEFPREPVDDIEREAVATWADFCDAECPTNAAMTCTRSPHDIGSDHIVASAGDLILARWPSSPPPSEDTK